MDTDLIIELASLRMDLFMMKKRTIFLAYICIVIMVSGLPTPGVAFDKRGVGIIIEKTSPEDGTAVTRNEKGDLVVIRVGDAVMNGRGKVVEIGTDRIVIEMTNQNGPETIIVNAGRGKKTQQVYQITKTPEPDIDTVSYPIRGDQVENK